MSIRSLASTLASLTVAASLLTACGTTPVERSVDAEAARKRAEVHLQLAVGYYSRGQFDIAQEEIRKALAIERNNVDIYNVQGLVFMSQGQAAQAESSFQRALNISSDNPEVLNNYGWFLCQSGREKESLQYFDKVLLNRAYQNQARVLTNAGICSVRMKNLQLGESYFTRAFELEPGNPSINTNLANVYYRTNQLPRAQFYVHRALKSENAGAETLWLAVRVERKLGNETLANSYANQLRRGFPQSPEYAAYLRGAFDE